MKRPVIVWVEHPETKTLHVEPWDTHLGQDVDVDVVSVPPDNQLIRDLERVIQLAELGTEDWMSGFRYAESDDSDKEAIDRVCEAFGLFEEDE